MNEGILRCLGVAVPSDSMYEMAQFYESIDLKVKTVTGYPGSTDIFAAIDRSEVNGDVMSLATVRG